MKKLNNVDFWKIIKKMNWASDCNYDRISNEIATGDYGDREIMIRFLKTWKIMEANLYKAVDSLSEEDYTKYINKGDDSLSDLIAHIIGLGKKHYQIAVKNPERFYIYTDEARESFAYILHTIYDLEAKNHLLQLVDESALN